VTALDPLLAHPTTGKDAPTPHDHTTPAVPQVATTASLPPRQPHGAPIPDTNTHPNSQAQATYIRHIAESAPLPNPAQLQRLADLLHDPGNPCPSS
jgi:hypothetical protein